MNDRLKIYFLCGGLLLFALLACQPLQKTPTPYPVPPLSQLQFTDAQTGDRFRTLDACIRGLTDASWKGGSYELLGNFYQADWCAGAGARDDCQIAGGTIDIRDQHAIQLYSLFYRYDFKQMFGLGLQTLWIPKSTGWGANFYFSEKGEGIVGEGWGVIFRQYLTSSQPVDATVDLDWQYGYIIYGPNQTTIELHNDTPLRQDLAQYLQSAEGMRDLGLKNIHLLAVEVESKLRGHMIMGCDLGPYHNDGVPPVCNPRPMTDAEEAAEINKAQKYFAQEEELLTEHYQEMYAAWMASFPLNQCWP